MELVSRPIATVQGGFVRHHPDKLAQELILLHAERNVRIARDFKADKYQAEKRGT